MHEVAARDDAVARTARDLAIQEQKLAEAQRELSMRAVEVENRAQVRTQHTGNHIF